MKHAYILLIFISLILTAIRTYVLYRWSKKNGYGKDSYEEFLATDAGKKYKACGKAITATLLLALLIYLSK